MGPAGVLHLLVKDHLPGAVDDLLVSALAQVEVRDPRVAQAIVVVPGPAINRLVVEEIPDTCSRSPRPPRMTLTAERLRQAELARRVIGAVLSERSATEMRVRRGPRSAGLVGEVLDQVELAVQTVLGPNYMRDGRSASRSRCAPR